MKKVLQLSLIVVFLALMSCEKKQISQNEIETEVSSIGENSPGLFKKEVIVTDESGQNSLFIAIYSDLESAIEEYLNNTELSLILEEKEIIEKIKQNSEVSDISTKGDIQPPKVEKEHSVVVEIVRTNLETNVEAYSLEVKTKENNTKDFQYGTYADYSSSSDFAGIVHGGTGYNLWVSTQYKNNWLSGWTTVYAGYLYPTSTYYAYVDTYDTYRTGIGVYLDARQGSQNYVMTFTKSNYYSHTCAIGSYDYNNYGECYLGTAPVGTSAFFYTFASGNTYSYYTPLSGNSCPLPGSSFDGANCRVQLIPPGCYTYTWQRNWLVQSNKII